MRYSLFVFLVLLAISCGPDSGTQLERPNVIFIIADDLNTDLSCYSHPLVHSPNIDGLAGDGTIFTKAYCQVPLCGPSRVSILTGLRPNPDSLMVLCNETSFRELAPSMKTMPQWFKEHGYHSVRFGKIFHQSMPGPKFFNLDDAVSWDGTYDPTGGGEIPYYGSAEHYLDGQTNYNYAFAPDTLHSTPHSDELVATAAIDYLRSPKAENKPFFMAVGFYRPHSPYIAPKSYFDYYDLENIALAGDRKADTLKYPAIAYSTKDPFLFDAMSDSRQREVVRAYYASISFMDAQVGRIIKTLKEQGTYDNTIIVFTSDHGYALGEHGMWQKQSLYEKMTRVPLILKSIPNNSKKKTEERVVELIDIFPTLTNLSRLPNPEGLEGESLLSERQNGTALSLVGRLADGVPFEREELNCNMSVGGVSIRNDSIRYTQWFDSLRHAEIYDYRTDPEESNNVLLEQSEEIKNTDLNSKIMKYEK